MNTQPPPFNPSVQPPTYIPPKKKRGIAATVLILFVIAFVLFVGISMELDMGKQEAIQNAPPVDTAALLQSLTAQCNGNQDLIVEVTFLVNDGTNTALIRRMIDAVQHHIVLVGMPEKAVYLSLGKPKDVSETSTSLGNTKLLQYDDEWVDIGVDGNVDKISYN